MPNARSILVAAIWVVPFSLTTGLGFFDWETWVMLVAVSTHAAVYCDYVRAK